MPFYSAGDGDLKIAFVSDAWLIDRFVGNTLFCCGLGTNGQLGDNTVTSKSNLVQTIAQGNNWSSVSLGSSGTNLNAGIKTDGTLWLWGDNGYGQIGDNTATKRSSPVQTVAFGTNWKQVCCGATNFTIALKTDGTLWGWGGNQNGQLGDNTVTTRSSPVQTVTFGTNWKQISATYHTAAIKTDGTLWCWGLNSNGQLGDNTITTRSSPVQTVAFGTNWKQVACGGFQTAAIKTDGTLWCWGSNGNGQIGDNTITSRSSPVQTVAFGTNWKQVACGGIGHITAIKTDGTLWVWGQNSSAYPTLGDNTITNKSSPVQTIAFGTNWKQVNCGYFSTYAIKNDGTLWSWGYNQSGELGDNSTTPRSSPVQTSASGTNWKQVGGGKQSLIAITFADI